MPRVPDASSVTRLRAVQSSAVADPVKRSASYTPAAPALLFSLRASDAGRGMFPAQTYLAAPIFHRYVNPRHQGYVPGPAPPPRITIDLGGANFNGDNPAYAFGNTVPPAASFEVVIRPGSATNLDQISFISIRDAGAAGALFGSTVIFTNPVWPGAVFNPSSSEPNLTASSGTFPGIDTVITFLNVPVIPYLTIQFYGNTPPE